MIPKAMALAKTRQLAFVNVNQFLQNNLAPSSSARPVVFTTPDSFRRQSLICDSLHSNFLFPCEFAAGVEVEEAHQTRFVDVRVLKKAPLERRIVPYRDLAEIHVDDAMTMSYLGHVGAFLDQLYNVNYCSKCGTALQFPSQTCAVCVTQRYARVSPCAMVLVHDEDRILMCQHARTKHWSLVAGFCEPLESMEACAEREVFEETGVRVDDVQLAFSQPWPFPRHVYEGTSLMFGCFARAKRQMQVPKADGKEVISAEWVQAKDVYSRVLPGRASISRVLIDSFVETYL